MDILQKRMEELQRQYMKEKENLRVELVSTLLSARKMAQEQEEANNRRESLESPLNMNPQLLQLQQQKQLIQQQIDEHIKQQQRGFMTSQANTRALSQILQFPDLGHGRITR